MRLTRVGTMTTTYRADVGAHDQRMAVVKSSNVGPQPRRENNKNNDDRPETRQHECRESRTTTKATKAAASTAANRGYLGAQLFDTVVIARHIDRVTGVSAATVSCS